MNLRAAMVVVSDGADTASDRSLLQTLDVVRRNDAFVYAIAIDAPDGRDSTRVNPEALRDITGLSGGYTEVVRSAADLGPATARIADELNKQYTIGYSSIEAARRHRGGRFASASEAAAISCAPAAATSPNPPAEKFPLDDSIWSDIDSNLIVRLSLSLGMTNVEGFGGARRRRR